MVRTKGSSAYVFGPHAPHKNTAFPATTPTLPTNITLAELLCFFPYWLKSSDIVYRIVANGLTAKTCAIMLNHFRILPDGPTTSNSMYTMMKLTMRTGGWGEGWTLAEHNRLVAWAGDGEEGKEGLGWDGRRLDVAGFKTECEDFPKKHGGAAGLRTILFRDLAKDVKNFPESDDALDLTRCVEYAIAHPGEEYIFPDDWDEVLQKVGGAKEVVRRNWDFYVVQRWNGVEGIYKRIYSKKKKGKDAGERQGVVENGAVNQQEGSEVDAEGETDDELYGYSTMTENEVRAVSVDDLSPQARAASPLSSIDSDTLERLAVEHGDSPFEDTSLSGPMDTGQ